MSENKIFNMEVLKTLYQNRFKLIKVFISASLFSALVSLALPEWYRTSSTILPPVEEGGLGSFASMLSDIPLKALGLGSGVSDESILFTATLNSRTAMEAVVNEFDLIKVYDVKNTEEAVKTLRDHAGIVIDEEGTLTVFAEARGSWFCFFSEDERNKARVMARDMVAFFVKELDRINKRLKAESASNSLKFIEKRYHQNLADLEEAENDLKDFQEKYGMISLEDQTMATIRAAAEIKAQIVSKEIELGVMQQSVSKTHAEYLRTQRELSAIKNRFKEFKAPLNYEKGSGEKIDVFVPLEDAPSVGLEFARRYREVFIQEKILEFILPQYEQAKITETKDSPTLQVLDPAVLPIKKHSPKRAIFVVFITLLACLGAFFYIIYKPAMKTFMAELKN